MRLTALKVLEILREESDKRHPLQKIADKLAEEFDSTGSAIRGNPTATSSVKSICVFP